MAPLDVGVEHLRPLLLDLLARLGPDFDQPLLSNQVTEAAQNTELDLELDRVYEPAEQRRLQRTT